MMSIRWGLVILAVVSVLEPGCATPPSRRERLLNRAAFDLQCGQEQLTFAARIDERTYAVSGCGRQATYVEMCDASVNDVMRRCTWVVNTAVPVAAE